MGLNYLTMVRRGKPVRLRCLGNSDLIASHAEFNTYHFKFQASGLSFFFQREGMNEASYLWETIITHG